MTLPQFIKAVRLASDLKQTELAELTGCSQASIAKYESGTEPGLYFIRRFRELFGYDLVDEKTLNQKVEKRYDKERGKTLYKFQNGKVPDLVLPIIESEIELLMNSLSRIHKAAKETIRQRKKT